MNFSLVHILALVKGTAEGDSRRHFASFMGLDHHEASAINLGLLERNEVDSYDLVLTPKGQELYESARLADLPQGRANSWSGLPPLRLAQELLGS
jgi:hypothetical protein